MVINSMSELFAYWSILYAHNPYFYSSIIFFSSLVLSLLGHYFFINYFSSLFCARARNWTPANHQLKNGTPSMGGIVIITVTILILFIFSCTSLSTLLCIGCLVLFGVIGGWDDWNKIRSNNGIHARMKFIWQLLSAGIISLLLISMPGFSTMVYIPFFHISYDFGWLFIPWAMFILIGTSNAVNLTDGLDGLAMTSLLLNFGTYGFIALTYCHSNDTWSVSLDNVIGIITVLAAVVGSGLGFLWYNTYPAAVIMGDVGALSLGALLGLIALITKQELLLPFTGVIFVAETVSVMLQVTGYRLYKKRFFKMAPLHHHFELIGWSEPKIIVRFSIMTAILCIFAIFLYCY